MAIEKFTVKMPETALDDLKRRLDLTRWPDELPGAIGRSGRTSPI